MPDILILSRRAAEYHRLLSALELPGANLLPPGAEPAECEIVLGDPSHIRPRLAGLGGLRWVQSTWAGIEPLLDPALPRNYHLTNARGVFGSWMIEFIFGYLLAHERKILRRYEAQKAARWDAGMPGTLRGKTIGLLGVGSIGAEVARAAKFFQMTVRGYTQGSRNSTDVDAYYHGADLPAFAAGLDYLVCILPNTPATRGLVGAELLAQLPPHAVLVNVGRGPSVDEAALLDALQRGALAGAVLDVFNEEPLPAGHPFWHAPNLLITSHTSAPSFPEDILGLFAENYHRYITGQPLKYEVDFEQGY